MRQIKFRAWWRYINSYEGTDEWKMSDVKSIHIGTNRIIISNGSFGNRSVDIGEECVIQQFTGLLDKNGVEIYEGDIVFYEKGNTNFNGEIIYSAQKYLIKGITSILSAELDEDYVSIIGNIYENPELLK